jgi:hypothetical protein
MAQDMRLALRSYWRGLRHRSGEWLFTGTGGIRRAVLSPPGCSGWRASRQHAAPDWSISFEHSWTQHHIPVPAALATTYVNHHALAVDIAHLQVHDLYATCSARVKHHDQDALKSGAKYGDPSPFAPLKMMPSLRELHRREKGSSGSQFLSGSCRCGACALKAYAHPARDFPSTRGGRGHDVS